MKKWKKILQRITKIKTFISKYNWEKIYFPSEKHSWTKIEKNNVIIAFNAFYAKKEKIYPAYAWKHDSNCEKQVILLMILNEEKWNYLAVKTLSAIPSKHHNDFQFLNRVHFFQTWAP